MSWLTVIWDDRNTAHVAEHGLTPDDIDAVLMDPEDEAVSDSSGQPLLFGHTLDGRYILVCIYEIDAETVYPITAHEVPEPRR